MIAWASIAGSVPVVISQLQVSQVVHAPEGDVLKPADEARPSDQLQYRAVYTNRGDTPAVHLFADLPVPPGTTLEATGLEPGDAQGTVDGSHFAPMPLMHAVVDHNGQSHQEPVPLADIRGLRWDLGSLAPRQTKSVQLRVRVNTTTTASDRD